jgi:2-polyprenyl-6-methoxyphenol hydroxylase-like FAD-dependent oxidoreductase/predicted DsbA family dithiol-disulfide isomerase
MKIVIIGGGIAGLALSHLMIQKGHEIVINERCNEIPLTGNAFMMHEEALTILKNILGPEMKMPGSMIDTFILKRPNDEEVKYTKMEAWQCVKRVDLVKTLLAPLDKNIIKFGRSFSYFIYKNNKAVAAVFENGDVEVGDVFVGADGCNSQVRQLLFGETKFTDVEVKEILGIVRNVEITKQLKGVFTKYQDAEKGISFGCIPISETECVWFNQFDVSLCHDSLDSKAALKNFSSQILKDFPAQVQTILAATDFNESYLWNTKDFDPLSSFHAKNIVLIGDAAHLALPFTSAGTTNALYDAAEMAAVLEDEKDLEKAFTQFYQKRIESIKEHVMLGRKLKKDFLFPSQIGEKDIQIPLIKYGVAVDKRIKTDQHLEIMYFTDPICSTCWSIQPQLRKMKMAYREKIEVRYIMGGLLPSWNDFNRGGIQKPADVYPHWREVAAASGMPIDGSLWLEDNPLHSSYPPSIAFKAAQLQDYDKALVFLRRLNELVFFENKNIADDNIIKKAAFDIGLDAARLLRDMKFTAPELFYNDISLSKQLEINLLPTFAFKVNGEIKEFLSGAQSYETFEAKIKFHYPELSIASQLKSPVEIFKEYPSLTLTEFEFLSDTNNLQSQSIISNLLRIGMIREDRTLIGSVFYSNIKNGRLAA